MDALTTSNVYLEMPTQYASDIETILNAEHDAIMTASETVDEGIQKHERSGSCSSRLIKRFPQYVAVLLLHHFRSPFIFRGRASEKVCPSGAGMHSARPAYFLENGLYFRERRLFYGECCCPE